MATKTFFLWISLLFISVVFGQQQENLEEKQQQKNLKEEQQEQYVLPEEKYRTPRAGEAIKGTFPLFGFELDIPERDRSETMAINLGVAIFKPKLGEDSFIPFGAFFYADTWEEHKRRIRLVAVGVVNFIDFYEGSWNDNGFEFMFTWENSTIPVPSSLIIEDQELEDSSIYWGHLRGGLGIGWRTRMAPWHYDNTLSFYFLYEPSLLYFKSTSDTADNYIVPSTTYEDRFHFRLRYDAFERNVMEMRHEGWAGGLDVIRGHRYHWKDHDFNGSFKEKDTKTYHLVSGYLMWTGGPEAWSERHRFSVALHGAFAPGDGLDRYSAFTIGGGPTGDEADALARATVAGLEFDEFVVSRYLMLSVEYRVELLFFLYLHFKGSVGPLRRMELDEVNREVSLSKNEWVGSLGVALTSGFAWDSQIYLEYVSDRGLFRGEERKNGHNFLFSWSKGF